MECRLMNEVEARQGNNRADDVNRLANLTPYRRPILTPSRGVI